jgi:hypothetical protein
MVNRACDAARRYAHLPTQTSISSTKNEDAVAGLDHIVD